MKLEEFIKQHRSEFDDRQPSPEVWKRIREDMHEKPIAARMVSISVLYKVAASVVLLIGVGVVLGLYIGSLQSNQDQFTQAKEYQDIENYYQGQIDDRMKRLASYNVSPEVQEDLHNMDQLYQELRSEETRLASNSQEQHINAIIKNYESRIAIMEKVLERMKQHSEKKQNDSHDEQIQI